MTSIIPSVVVIISANTEWQVVRRVFPQVEIETSPYGEWFITQIGSNNEGQKFSTSGHLPVLFFHGGWGKIAAAASTQYIIDQWKPDLLVNLGTCGGFEGLIERGTILLVEKTIVYDLIEQMGDYDAAIAHYTTEIDLSWLEAPFPQEVIRTLLVSGDRDLLPEDILQLKEAFNAKAGDWESGAIAWVAARNNTRTLILRGVTDLVGSGGGEAYGNINLFRQATQQIIGHLLESLPDWIHATGFR